LQREILVQNVRKKFWNLWRKFKKRRWEAKPYEGRKHNSSIIMKKPQKVYDFLKETAFCSFQQYEKMLPDTKERDIFNSTFNSFGEKQDYIFEKKDFQTKFSEMMQDCFNQDVR
jgi:hypothetical protein